VCRLKDARIAIVSGMMGTKGEDYSTLESIRASGGVRPDATWDENLRAAEGNAIFAQRIGVSLVTFHAGFLPHTAGDPERERMLERLARLAEVFAARQVNIAVETGQESAQTLLGVLEDLDRRTGSVRVGVNFDPANMILYGMGDPVEAVRLLAPRISQVHIKDANPSDSLGEWGSEMPVGRGSVRWKEFLGALDEAGYEGRYLIEREAGDDRVQDVTTARDYLAAI